MANSIKAKLFAGASSYAPLTALLTASVFQWGDQQLSQNFNLKTHGAVVVQQISNPQSYTVAGRLPTSFSRVQFTIYGIGNDSQNADAIADALISFLDQWDGGSGIPGLSQYSNLVVGDRDFGVAQTNPMTYTRILDVQIFNNSQA